MALEYLGSLLNKNLIVHCACASIIIPKLLIFVDKYLQKISRPSKLTF